MLPADMLVIDESSSFKSPKSLRFKALRHVQASFKRIVILTGTPAPNGLIDLWSQIWLLDRGERLGKTISTYRDLYFKPDKRNGEIIFNYKLDNGGEEAIHEKIKDICISMSAKDYLDLPARINNYIDIEFSPELQKKYDDFEKDMILEMFGAGQEINAANTAVLRGKLLQFTNGAIYDVQRNYHIVHDLKLDALEEIVENANGKPVLVAYTFIHDCERILERLKKYKVKKLETDKDIDNWNAGKIPVMIMHPASGGHGLNLQAGGNIIVFVAKDAT
jgi:SNF2 family DNA or RNA helicase